MKALTTHLSGRGRVAFLIRKEIGEDDPFRLGDFAIDARGLRPTLYADFEGASVISPAASRDTY